MSTQKREQPTRNQDSVTATRLLTQMHTTQQPRPGDTFYIGTHLWRVNNNGDAYEVRQHASITDEQARDLRNKLMAYVSNLNEIYDILLQHTVSAFIQEVLGKVRDNTQWEWPMEISPKAIQTDGSINWRIVIKQNRG